MADSIYVEIRIRGPMDELWRLTQTPDLHERWDLRFSTIEYLPRAGDEPQRFRYATRIGFGLRIEGAGESVGENHGPSGRTSALRFWSDDAKSLIREGAGYWKYSPCEDEAAGIRFLTRYDYRTRFGRAGALVDRFLFRPLLGWATAWSFDRLRLWIEKSIDPALSMRLSAVHAVARISLALLWIYQGVVPKLLFRATSGELETVRRSNLFEGLEHFVVIAAGVGEILFGIALLALWRARALFAIQVLVLLLLGVAAAVSDPSLFAAQFGPATLNLAMIALGIIGWIASVDLPTAANCLRKEAR